MVEENKVEKIRGNWQVGEPQKKFLLSPIFIHFFFSLLFTSRHSLSYPFQFWAREVQGVWQFCLK